MRRTTSTLIPKRVLSRPAIWHGAPALDRNVARTTARSVAGEIDGFRPRPGAMRPIQVSPLAVNCLRQARTVSSVRWHRRAISALGTPSTARSSTRAWSRARRDREREREMRCSSRRVSSSTTSGGASRRARAPVPDMSRHGNQVEVEVHGEGDSVVGALQLLMRLDGQSQLGNPARFVVLFAADRSADGGVELYVPAVERPDRRGDIAFTGDGAGAVDGERPGG